MAEQFDLVVVGHAIMDVVRTCDDDFLRRAGLVKGSMTIAQSPRQIAGLAAHLGRGFEVAGGSAANVAVGIASFGGRAAFVGQVADDDLGHMFAHDIRGAGVTFEAPPAEVSQRGTSHSLILVTPDSQRTMVTYLGCSVGVDQLLAAPHAVAPCRILYLEGYLFDCPSAGTMLARVAHRGRMAGGRIAFCLPAPQCIGRHRGHMRKFVKARADVLFANEKELLSLYDVRTLEDGLKRVEREVGLAVVTRSEQGAIVVAEGERIAMPGETVRKVVDSTGAGDMYAAGFLYSWLRDGDVHQADRIGRFAAGEIITVRGARPEVRFEHLAKMRGLFDRVGA